MGRLRSFQDAEGNHLEISKAVTHQAVPELIDDCIQLRQFRHGSILSLLGVRLGMNDLVKTEPVRQSL